MSSKSPLSLNIAILGAGLAGLSCAIALAQQGHKITVLERRNALSEIGAGVQVPPNASRILISWGLEAELQAQAENRSDVLFVRYLTGETLARMPPASSDLPNWLIYRPDYQRVLYDAAVQAGAIVRFDVHVTKIDQDNTRLEIGNGEFLTPDLILGADGIGSSTRKTILNDKVELKVTTANYRVLIPREKMLQNAQAAPYLHNAAAQVWMGPGRTVVMYPIAQGKFYNMVLEHPGSPPVGKWNLAMDMNAVREQFQDFAAPIPTLLSLADSCYDWAVARVPILHSWSSTSGKILLVGDAAHATLPHLAQGAAMCTEDAAVLAECLARVTDRSQIPTLTTLFQEIRKPRTERIQAASDANSKRWTIPDGPEQEARDAKWKVPSKMADGQGANEFREAAFRRWLFEYDAVAETRNILDKAGF
ncbi:FAD-dependent monooxygenase OpS4 [Acrodontium crateriforme]|uniref:FAD-dependent monooxygenase OpS4 n=1 Tax=Acrodontium crateriforme TaxID=150365 RepID=A0AAQ3MAM2_9PEZI|nr:FAD-dependent monooxygenase OpS4 [Acrodontium crateriforme]